MYQAIQRIQALEGTALQLFTRNQRQWNPKPLQQAVDFGAYMNRILSLQQQPLSQPVFLLPYRQFVTILS
ncbi:MAG: hypothetical protein R6U22_07110 [Desulfohalobiaceae bacterium]